MAALGWSSLPMEIVEIPTQGGISVPRVQGGRGGVGVGDGEHFTAGIRRAEDHCLHPSDVCVTQEEVSLL